MRHEPDAPDRATREGLRNFSATRFVAAVDGMYGDEPASMPNRELQQALPTQPMAAAGFLVPPHAGHQSPKRRVALHRGPWG